MYLILLALGIAAIAAGGVMVGFGIPINEFGLGNTLIVAGTTAISGGLIMIGLAAAVRQLTRIAKSLELRAPARAPVETVASADAPSSSPDHVEPVAAPPEPVPAAPDVKPEPPMGAPAEAGEPAAPIVAPVRPAARGKGADLTAPPNGGNEPAAITSPARPQARAQIPRVLSPRERGFDTVWQSDQAGQAPRAGEADRAEATPAAAGDAVAIRAARGPQAVTVLKSGVIDGMAYTLYSDGSIEAELPQGTMRFATIEELRVYLASNP